jgi:hypothetical protein
MIFYEEELVIDPKEFVKYLEPTFGYKSPFVPDDDYALNDDETGFILRLFNIQTFGGMMHAGLNNDGDGSISHPTDVNVKPDTPFRLSNLTVYVVTYHLRLREIPKGTIAYVVPTPDVAQNGLIMTPTYIRKGDLKSTIHPGRTFTFYPDFPMATLCFDKIYHKTKKDSEK